MTMVSYAQAHEDVVLARAFAGQVRGFYIDIGAEHPEHNSVTRHFYELGWRGINVEPSARSLALLKEGRPEDINLGVGVGAAEGKATFFEGPADNHGSSTFRPDIARGYQRLGQVFDEVADVPVTTLALLCEEYVGDHAVDLLKVDVEGMESEVIGGADWTRWRPRVVVVEATEPNSRRPSHHAWEPTLLAAGYVFALFDGLNRFYARGDSPELLELLSSPACVFDDFVDATVRTERLAAAAERDELAAGCERRVADARREAAAGRAATAVAQDLARQAARAARVLEDRLHGATDEALRAELGAVALRDRLSEEITARLDAEGAVRLLEDRLAVAAEDAARAQREAAARSARLAEEVAGRRLADHLRGAAEAATAAEHAARVAAEGAAVAARAARDAAEEAAGVERVARRTAEEELRALQATRTFRWSSGLRTRVYRLRRPSAG